MNFLPQDLRYAVRMLLNRPGFTLIAVLTLALGIGANTALFSVINAVLLRPLPYAQAERLVLLWGNFQMLKMEHVPAKAAEFLDYQARNQSFDQVAAYTLRNLTLTGLAQPEPVVAARVSANLLPLVGARALLGRLIQAEETAPNSAPVVVLSHGFWQRALGGARDVLGRTLTLDEQNYTVVGVLPAGFQFPHEDLLGSGRVDLWTPLTFTPEQITQRQRPYYLTVVARLKPGVTVAQAQSDMDNVARSMDVDGSSYRGPNNSSMGWRVQVVPLLEELVGKGRRALWILFAAVSLVLLIACANVANLLLARATTRQKELAIRGALGASRTTIIRQLLVESLLLAGLGSAAGLLLAWWGVKLLTWLKPEALPRVGELSLDWRVLAFTAALAVLTGLVFGLAPAWQTSQVDLQQMLKEGGATTGGGRRSMLRNLLVVGEVAVALVLLIGAGLLINSFLRLQRVNTGVRAERILTASLTLPTRRYQTAAQRTAFFQDLLLRIAALPGVEAASAGSVLPLSGTATTDPFAIEGRPLDMNRPNLAGWQVVTPAHFRTLGLPLLRGREFNESDNADAPRVTIINESAARAFWPNEDALGKRVTLGLPRADNPWTTVIGIVKDLPQRAVDSKPGPDFYFPFLQRSDRALHLLVRTANDPNNSIEAIRQQVGALDKEQPITAFKTLDEVIAATTAPRRFNTLLLGVFAAVALLLATLGIYSVISYTTAQRTREIGVRMALGAQAQDVLRLVIRQGMTLALLGVAVGVAAAFVLTRWLKTLLYEVSATDPLTFALLALLLAGVALLACYLPARRAARVDPLIALRCE
jgi:putative ABC transport system permease protein